MALVVFNPTDGGLSFANVRPIGQLYVETGINEKGVFVELNNGSASDPNINENAVFSVASLFDFLRTSETLDEMVQNIVTTKWMRHTLSRPQMPNALSLSRSLPSMLVLSSSKMVPYTRSITLPALRTSHGRGKFVELPDNAYDDR